MELLQGDEVLYDSDISVGYSSQVDSEVDIEGIVNNFNQPLNNRPWINVDANGYVRPHQIQPFTEPTGMARRLPIDVTPLDYFKLLITNPQTDQTLISLLVEETNRLGRDVIVDESLVGFKGRNHLVQYMPAKKSHRWGPKFFLLAESDTGYVHQLRLYAGKSQNQRNPQGVKFDKVVDLLQPHFNKYHHVTLDNFFCSPSLCHHLYQNGMYCTGTVRVFRKGMPPSFRNIQIAKGEMTVRQQGPLMAVALQNASNSRGVERELPNVAVVYNSKMGGVDLSDQHISYYSPDIRSVKMWKKVLMNLLSRVIANSYILYKQVRMLHKKMSRLEFTVSVVQGLIGHFREERKSKVIYFISNI
ncbi:hypothetical protein KUTeg_005684 [Tegillarca granosa]|uniref:PiggyBac transposable element-derived protein domain-containing protein n=1 Tax=Tegillarca granosa TaxID=220873 RepID=A0ABQ9FLZ9_TEGGR|nr:hypothetical protein KUTeg_005684 [Tegillarca granosa]